MQIRKALLNSEQGMVLVISLLILALLIGAGVGAIVSTQTDLKTSSNLKTATLAFYIAEAGIERAKYELSGSKTFNSALAGADGNKSNTSDNGILSFGSSVSFGGGTYAVTVTDNSDGDSDSWADADNKIYISSTGTYGSSTRTIKVLVTKANLDFNAALSIVDDQCEIHQGGSATVTGLNYTYNPQNQNNPTRVSAGPDVNGIARNCTNNPNDAANTNVDYINQPNGITGKSGTTPDMTTDLGGLTSSSIQSVWRDLRSSADITYSGSTTISGNQTLGTRDSPKIIYANDSLKIAGTVTGVGILIVDKDFEVTGNFTFEGIVLIGACDPAIKTDCSGRLKDAGNAKIYGATALANPTSSHSEESRVDKMQGNNSFYYSTYAIDLAMRKTFRSLAWQEISN